MPRTPVEARLAKTRTSSTGKRIALPLLAASRMSLASVQTATPIRRSPSRSFIAILPLAFTSTKSESSLRRASPLEVANMTLSCDQVLSSSGSGMMVEMVSPSSSGSRLISALPRAWGLPTGIFQTLDL